MSLRQQLDWTWFKGGATHQRYQLKITKKDHKTYILSKNVNLFYSQEKKKEYAKDSKEG